MVVIANIKGYDDGYLATNCGQIISLRYCKVKYLKPGVQHAGYLHVNLWKEGKSRSCKIHQLVLEAFGFHREEGQVCRHLNGDPTDNRLANLRWGTMRENAVDMVRHGRGPKCCFTPEQIGEIKLMPGRNKDIAKKFGVSTAYIWMIKAGKRGYGGPHR